MVLQLPIRSYPQDSAEAICDYHRYDLLRAFVHSRSLRWSHGAFQGREGDSWQQALAEQAIPDMLELASDAGFGVPCMWISFAYPDRGRGAGGGNSFTVWAATHSSVATVDSRCSTWPSLMLLCDDRTAPEERQRPADDVLVPLALKWRFWFLRAGGGRRSFLAPVCQEWSAPPV